MDFMVHEAHLIKKGQRYTPLGTIAAKVHCTEDEDFQVKSLKMRTFCPTRLSHFSLRLE